MALAPAMARSEECMLGSFSRIRSGRGRLLWLAAVLAACSLAVAAPARSTPFVYVTNLGDGVSQYDVGAGGLLAPLVPVTVPAGVSPFGVTASPDGRSVYTANNGSDDVSQYDVGAGGGLSPKSPATVAAGAAPLGVAVSPDGQSGYVTNAGSG
jgi:DNA-binding beta-propeller fold protein YncE